jgi:hypothetical protein
VYSARRAWTALERDCGLDVGGICSKSADALSVEVRVLEPILLYVLQNLNLQ